MDDDESFAPMMDVTEYMDVEIAFHASDRWTQEVVHELDRLGYDIAQRTDSDEAGHLYLDHVGRRDLTVVLRVTPNTGDGYKIDRVVVWGEIDKTAAQAVPWLKKRAARTPRYLR